MSTELISWCLVICDASEDQKEWTAHKYKWKDSVAELRGAIPSEALSVSTLMANMPLYYVRPTARETTDEGANAPTATKLMQKRLRRPHSAPDGIFHLASQEAFFETPGTAEPVELKLL
jgi:hypothetical protein